MRTIIMLMATALCVAPALAGAYANADDAECRSYGAEKGSPAYVECRIVLAKERKDEQSDRARRFVRGFLKGWNAMDRQQQRAAPRTCDISRTWGDNWVQNCY